MVLKFEDYIKTNFICESFQSSKLRTIIKQHGKPKHDWDKKMLYDLKDSEIIDVVKDHSEFYDKYDNYKLKGTDKKFYIELEDGYCLVIGNLGILKSFFDSSYIYDRKDDIFKYRIEQRHKGRQSKYGGDNIHSEHMSKRRGIEHKRTLEKIKSIITDSDIKEIYDIIKDQLYDTDIEDDDTYEKEYDIKVGEYDAILTVSYNFETTDTYVKYGAYLADIYHEVLGLSIYIEDENIEDEFNDEELGIDLSKIKKYVEKGCDRGIEDPYEYYGVSRSDFY